MHVDLRVGHVDFSTFATMRKNPLVGRAPLPRLNLSRSMAFLLGENHNLDFYIRPYLGDVCGVHKSTRKPLLCSGGMSLFDLCGLGIAMEWVGWKTSTNHESQCTENATMQLSCNAQNHMHGEYSVDVRDGNVGVQNLQ